MLRVARRCYTTRSNCERFRVLWVPQELLVFLFCFCTIHLASCDNNLLSFFCSSPFDPRIDSTGAVLLLKKGIRSPKPLLFKTAFNKSPLRPRPNESGVKNIRIRVEGASILFAVGAVNASR